MGTNYYLHTEPCEHCGRTDPPLHIGKSSGSWCFALHVIPERGLNSLLDWELEWTKSDKRIRDEYDRPVTVKSMRDTICNRHGGSKPPDDSFCAINEAQPGPNNLARHRIGRWCSGHGEGTWDYCTGEFE